VLLGSARFADVSVHTIEPAKVASPEDGLMSGYFYRHADPAIPTYWLADASSRRSRAIEVPADDTAERLRNSRPA
jgi:hypothetical protein